MANNSQLSKLIGGKRVVRAQTEQSTLVLTFYDGSTMQIKCSGTIAAPDAIAGRVIDQVKQRGTALELDCTDGTTIALQTAAETSCVMVRNANLGFDYSD